MLTTHMCVPGCHRERAAEEHKGDPGCTLIWDCVGRCAPLPRGGTYSPKISKILNTYYCERTICTHGRKKTLHMLAANPKANQWVGDWVCLSIGVTRVTIQLWQLSKQQEGQVMTQQTALAWLTPYILSASVSEVSVHVFVSFVAYVDRCLPAAQMASMLLPFSTCCLLETLPLIWFSPVAAPLHPQYPPIILSGY